MPGESERHVGRVRWGALFGWIAAVDIGLAAAFAVDMFACIEWTGPSCAGEGHPGAVGTPLPYMEWCGYTSLRYLVVPHLLLIDLAAIALPAALAAHLLLGRWPWVLRVGGIVAAGIVGLRIALTTAGGAIGMYELAPGIAPFGGTYADYRPVGLALRAPYFCTPSPYWFGEDGG